MSELFIVILPGETRFPAESDFSLRRLCGMPSLRIVCEAAGRLAPGAVFVAAGQDPASVHQALEGLPVQFVGDESAGTAGVASLPVALRKHASPEDNAIVLPGNAPLIDAGCLSEMLAHHLRMNASITLAGESQEGSPPWFCCFRTSRLLQALDEIRPGSHPTPLTVSDLFAGEWRSSGEIEVFRPGDAEILRPMFNEEDLTRALRHLRTRKCKELMASGVQILEPALTFIDLSIAVDEGAVIHPLVTLEGATCIGTGSVIHSGTRISDSTIGPHVQILDSCVITDSSIGARSIVGPFAHLRNGASIGESCRVGNFVEIKKSTLGDGTKAAHLAYLGDAVIGRNVNIGAGTITCNYDGTRKHVTIIEDGAFIGTDSQLVAPVRIGRRAYVAAGSCITKDVPDGGLAIARSRQTVKQGWAHRLRKTD